MNRNNPPLILAASALGLLLTSFSGALASLTMDDQKVLEVSIGNKGLTRITVKGDSIQEILVHPISLQDSLRHHGGHLFIAPEGIKEPLYVTLMTQKGQTQDLHLTTSSSKGRPILLSPPEAEKKIEDLSEAAKIVLEGHLLSFAQGERPSGFKKVSRSIPKRTSGALQAYGEGIWVLGTEEIMTYLLENPSDHPVTLSPDQFLIQGELAVTFDRSVVLPQGQARMAVLRFGNEQIVSLPPLKSTPVFEREKP